MQYDFDKLIERRGTGALKYDALAERYGDADLLPLWVADMDFETPHFITEALRRRLDHHALTSLFVEQAKLALNDGEMFGPGGEGYMRLNVATPRSVLLEALERLHAAVEKITNQG